MQGGERQRKNNNRITTITSTSSVEIFSLSLITLAVNPIDEHPIHCACAAHEFLRLFSEYSFVRSVRSVEFEFQSNSVAQFACSLPRIASLSFIVVSVLFSFKMKQHEVIDHVMTFITSQHNKQQQQHAVELEL